jgi:hypothetical protein
MVPDVGTYGTPRIKQLQLIMKNTPLVTCDVKSLEYRLYHKFTLSSVTISANMERNKKFWEELIAYFP